MTISHWITCVIDCLYAYVRAYLYECVNKEGQAYNHAHCIVLSFMICRDRFNCHSILCSLYLFYVKGTASALQSNPLVARL